MKKFPFKLITPEGVAIDTSLWQVSASNSMGRFAIRAQHIDFFTTLNPGSFLAYSLINGNIQIESGFLEFKRDCGCTVICEKKLNESPAEGLWSGNCLSRFIMAWTVLTLCDWRYVILVYYPCSSSALRYPLPVSMFYIRILYPHCIPRVHIRLRYLFHHTHRALPCASATPFRVR